MRRAAAGAAVAACLAITGCCDDEQVAPVSTGDPATTFAPLVRMHEREPALPVDATRAAAHAGLEWASGHCHFVRDLTPSGWVKRPAPSPLPPLVLERLGRGPGYTAQDLRADCETPLPTVYSTVQRTRPFDTEDRPAGLPIDQGFNLDMVSYFLESERSLTADGSLASVPAYYALDATNDDPGAGIRISYWLFFGSQEGRPGSDYHGREGDWERIDVLARKGDRRGTYVPKAVEYRVGKRMLRVGWEDVELVARTHPVAYVDYGMHTPRPSRGCDRCLDWKTWRRLRDVRREPWFGYGGGWGGVGDEDRYSGPSGPSPFELGPSP